MGINKTRVATRRIYNLCKAIKKSGHECYLFYIDEGLNINNYDFSFIDFSLGIKPNLLLCLNLLRKIYDIFTKFVKNKKSETNLVENQKEGKIESSKQKREKIKKIFFSNNISTISETNIYYKININRFVKKVEKHLSSDIQNILFSSALPGTIHKAASKIKKRNKNIIWIADYRDPARFNNYAYNRQKDETDTIVAKNANFVTSVSAGCLEKIQRGYDYSNKKTMIMYNGFPVGYKCSEEKITSKDILNLAYLGAVYSKQDLPFLLIVINNFGGIKFHYAGTYYKKIDFFIREHSSSNIINYGLVSFEKSHQIMDDADILVLLKSVEQEEGVLTGKFFEYLCKNKPILVLGNKDKEFNDLFSNIGGVYICDYDKNEILRNLELIKKDNFSRNKSDLDRFSWENQFNILDKEIDEYKITKS